jgi:hypothetical protein
LLGELFNPTGLLYIEVKGFEAERGKGGWNGIGL